MKRIYFFSLLIISAVAFLSCKKDAPVLSKAFIKYFGGADVDLASEVRQTSDGGFIMIGTTNSNSAGGSDIYVVKTDQYGNEEWHKTFGDSLNDEGASIKQTADGGYILLGTYNYNADSTDIYAIRLNAQGNTTWSKVFGLASYNEKGISVNTTSDNGFIILGSTDSIGSVIPDLDLYAFKTDGNGTIVGFPFKYGAKGKNDNPSSIIQAFGGDYIISSSTDLTGLTPREVVFSEFSGGTPSNSQAKTDWSEPTLMTGGEIDKTIDGNYILIGTDNNNDIYLLKLTSVLNKLWTAPVIFGGAGIDEGFSVQSTSDGGYILLGTTQSFGEGLKDIYLIKTDANGQEQWHKTFGGAGNDIGHSVRQTTDGGYVISGTIEFGNDITNKDNIMCIIKTNENGALKDTK
jgi:hypothetical protein